MSFYGGFIGAGVVGGNDTIGGYDDLERYGDSVFSKAKEKIIRNIAEDVFNALKVSGAKNAQTAPIGEVVKHLAKICPNIKSGKKFNDKLNKSVPRQKEVCLALAESINKNYHSNIIQSGLSEHDMCVKVSEVMNSLMTGMHTEFMSVAADVNRIVNNLTTIKGFIDASYKRQKLLAQQSGDALTSQQSKEVADVYDQIIKELDRQLAMLANLMNVAISPTSKTLISLLEDNNEFKGMVRDLQGQVGTDKFGDKLAYLLSGVNTVAYAAETVDKALKKIGMSVKEYKAAKNLQQLRVKIYEHIQNKQPTSKDMEGLLVAMDNIMKNTQNHDQLVAELEKHEKKGRGDNPGMQGGDGPFSGGNSGSTYGGSTYGGNSGSTYGGDCCGNTGGGDAGAEFGGGGYAGGGDAGPEFGGGYDYGEASQQSANGRWERKSLSEKINKQDKYRKILMADFKNLLKGHYQTLINAINEITPNIGKNIPINDDLDKFISAFRNLKTLDRENLHIALSGYAKDVSSKNEREEFINTYNLLLMTLEPLAKGASGNSFRNISSAVRDMMKSVDDFSDKMVKVITEIHVDNPTEIRDALHKTSVSFFGSAEGGGGDGFFGSGSFVQFDKVKAELIYAYSIANIKTNLERSAAETVSFGKDYEQILGEGAAVIINDIKNEYKKMFDELENPAAPAAASTNCMGHLSDLAQAVRNYNIATNLNADSVVGGKQKQKYDNMKQTLRDLWTYQREAKIKMVETAQAVDLYLRSFTDGIAKNPEAISSVLSMLNQVQIVAKWFNERSGDNLAAVFETFPDQMDANAGAAAASNPQHTNYNAAGAVPLTGSVTRVIDGEKITLPSIDKSHYYDYLSSAANKNPGNPFIGIDIEDYTGAVADNEPAKKKKANQKFKTLNALTERTIKSMRALENILSAFATVGNKFGDLNLQSKTFMSPGQIFNSLNQYVIASAYTNQFLPALPARVSSKFRTVITTQQIDAATFPTNNPLRYRHPGDAASGNIKFSSEYGYSTEYGSVTDYGIFTGVSAGLANVADNNAVPPGGGVVTPLPVINGGNNEPERRKQILRKHTSIAMAAIPTDSSSLDKFWEYHNMRERDTIRLDAAGYVDRFFDTDLLFMMTVKSIVCKVFTAVDAYRLFNRPTIKNSTHNSVNPIRTILGGADVKVIPEALELYLRLPLLAEWYREVFGFKKNSLENDEKYVSVVPPSVDGIWSDFIRTIFDQTGYVQEGNYSENQVQKIIQQINEIFKTYKSKFPGATVRNILNAFVVETNRSMGFMKRSEISKYIENREKYINPKDENDYVSEEANFLNYDILDSDNQFTRNPAPSDKYVSASDAPRTLKDREHLFLMKEVIDLRKKMDFSFRKALGQESGSGNTSATKNLNTYSFISSLRNFKKSLDVAKNDKEAYEVVLNMIQGTNKLLKVAADKMLMLHESVAAPLSVLYNVYKVMAKFNAICHGTSTKNLNAFITKPAGGNTLTVAGLRTVYNTHLALTYKNENCCNQFVDTAVATNADAFGLENISLQSVPYAVECAMSRLITDVNDPNGANAIGGAGGVHGVVIPGLVDTTCVDIAGAAGNLDVNLTGASFTNFKEHLRKGKKFIVEVAKQIAHVVENKSVVAAPIAADIKAVYSQKWFVDYTDKVIKAAEKKLQEEVDSLLAVRGINDLIIAMNDLIPGLLEGIYGSANRNVGGIAGGGAAPLLLDGAGGANTTANTEMFRDIPHPAFQAATAIGVAPDNLRAGCVYLLHELVNIPQGQNAFRVLGNANIANVNNGLQENIGVYVELMEWFLRSSTIGGNLTIHINAINTNAPVQGIVTLDELLIAHPLVRAAAFLQVRRGEFPTGILKKHFDTEIGALVDLIQTNVNLGANVTLNTSLTHLLHRNSFSLLAFAIKSICNVDNAARPSDINLAIQLAGIPGSLLANNARVFSRNLQHVAAGVFIASSVVMLGNFRRSAAYRYYDNFRYPYYITHLATQHINAAVEDRENRAFGYWYGARPLNGARFQAFNQVLNGPLIARDLISAVMDLATNPNKLVSCSISDVGFVNLDMSKLEDICGELLSLVKNNINKLRIYLEDNYLKYYENAKYPGSVRWIEENLIEVLFKNRGDCGLPSALSDHLNSSIKDLSKSGADTPTLDNVLRELIYYKAEYSTDNLPCIIRYNNIKKFPFNVTKIKEQSAGTTLLSNLENENITQSNTLSSCNIEVDVPAVGFESNDTLNNWNFTDPKTKSLLLGFNKLVEQYLLCSIEEGSVKSYIPLFDQFINSAGSAEIIQGNSFPNTFNVKTVGNENAEYLINHENLPFKTDDASVLASPDEGSILFTSYALAMKNIVSSIDRIFKKKKHAYDNLNEMPEFMRERLRCNLPYFVKLFNIYYERAEFLKRLISTTDIKKNIASVVQIDTDVNVLAHRCVHTATNIKVINEAILENLPRIQGKQLIKTAGDSTDKRFKYYSNMLTKISEEALSLKKCADLVYKELQDVNPYFMDVSRDFIIDYKQRYGAIPLMPASNANLPQLAYSGSVAYTENVRPEFNYDDESLMLLPTNKNGSNYYKFNLAARLLLARSDVEPNIDHMPGAKDIYNIYANLSQKNIVISPESYTKTLVCMLKLSRFVNDGAVYGRLFDRPSVNATYRTRYTAYNSNSIMSKTEDLRTFLSNHLEPNFKRPAAEVQTAEINNYCSTLNKVGVVVVDVPATNDGTVCNVAPNDLIILAALRTQIKPTNDIYATKNAGPVTFQYNAKLKQAIALVENNAVKSAKEVFVKNITNISSDNTDKRADMRIYNILDMNIVPINVHAFMREVPFANILNYSYTFDQMVHEFIVPEKLQNRANRAGVDDGLAERDLMITPFEPSNNTRELLTKLLTYPYADLHFGETFPGKHYYALLGSLFNGNDDFKLGRPRYLSDQLWHKVLLTSSVQLVVDGVHALTINGEEVTDSGSREGGPASYEAMRSISRYSRTNANPTGISDMIVRVNGAYDDTHVSGIVDAAEAAAVAAIRAGAANNGAAILAYNDYIGLNDSDLADGVGASLNNVSLTAGGANPVFLTAVAARAAANAAAALLPDANARLKNYHKNAFKRFLKAYAKNDKPHIMEYVGAVAPIMNISIMDKLEKAVGMLDSKLVQKVKESKAQLERNTAGFGVGSHLNAYLRFVAIKLISTAGVLDTTVTVPANPAVPATEYTTFGALANYLDIQQKPDIVAADLRLINDSVAAVANNAALTIANLDTTHGAGSVNDVDRPMIAAITILQAAIPAVAVPIDQPIPLFGNFNYQLLGKIGNVVNTAIGMEIVTNPDRPAGVLGAANFHLSDSVQAGFGKTCLVATIYAKLNAIKGIDDAVKYVFTYLFALAITNTTVANQIAHFTHIMTSTYILNRSRSTFAFLSLCLHEYNRIAVVYPLAGVAFTGIFAPFYSCVNSLLRFHNAGMFHVFDMLGSGRDDHELTLASDPVATAGLKVYRNGQWIKAGPNAKVMEDVVYCAEVGRARFDTKLVRNLTWFVQLQRIMRTVLINHLSWISEPVVKGLKITESKITEYNANDEYNDNDYNVQEDNVMF
jgi:hypothetical protein